MKNSILIIMLIIKAIKDTSQIKLSNELSLESLEFR